MVGARPSELFERAVVPVASDADARRARNTILPYLAEDAGVVILVHAIRVSEGGIDPSPVDAQEAEADRLFEAATRDHDVEVETRKAYGQNVSRAILETARAADATVIAVSPRPKGLITRLLTGDPTRSLVTNPDLAVLAVPYEDGGDEGEGDDDGENEDGGDEGEGDDDGENEGEGDGDGENEGEGDGDGGDEDWENEGESDPE